jgi:protein SCO1/2
VPRRRPPRAAWVRLGLFTAAVGLFLGSYYWGNQYRRESPPEVSRAILLRPPVTLPAFTARDSNGHAFGPQRFAGHWSLLLLGPLDHPDTATGLALQTRVLNRLAATPELQRQLWPLLLSPAPDTPAQLRRTAAAYNPALVTASGSPAGLQPLLTALGSQAGAPPLLYLIDPRIQAVAVFPPDQPAAGVAADVIRLLEAAD